jgi:hypothetical protein
MCLFYVQFGFFVVRRASVTCLSHIESSCCLANFSSQHHSFIRSCIRRCYLVTFYFTRQLMDSPGLTPSVEGKEPWINLWIETSQTTSSTTTTANHASAEEEKVIEFVKSYGAYLKLHTCIVRASDVGSGPILRALLDMARFDLRHRDCLKRLSNKQTTLFLYEPVSSHV